jgi:DNA mismatch repair protein MutS
MLKSPSSQPTSNGSPTERLSTVFHSVLYDRPVIGIDDLAEPSSFHDLGLDQVVTSVLGKDDENLRPLFWRTLPDARAVHYRHEVFRDLERTSVAEAVRAFSSALRSVRGRLRDGERIEYRHLGGQLFLDTAQAYCDSVVALAEGLAGEEIGSSGLTAFRRHLAGYVESGAFNSLRVEAEELERSLSQVRYSLMVRGTRVTVRLPDQGSDYGSEVALTFARFREGDLQDYRVPYRSELSMGHVQEFVLERVARRYPQEFAELQSFRVRRAGFPDPTLIAFAHEVQFYLAMLDHLNGLKRAGLDVCYPIVSEGPASTHAVGAFDLALAAKRVTEGRRIVPNDFRLTAAERVIVVTGPNQGGKTTFARLVGQLHYLAALGVPVPGREAKLMLPDTVFTHFEREEQAANLRGKLEDELLRVRAILDQATERSAIIMNESFSSTTLDDSRLLGGRVLERIIETRAICVYVTFVDDLAAPRNAVVSMVAGVAPDDPATRTFRVVRGPASGRAYAEAIARKYGLTSTQLRERKTP